MKKLLLTTALLFISVNFYAQDFKKNENIKLESLDDYKKAEPDVLKCADFLLRTPIKPETANRLNALAFVVKWMSGTNYTFNVDSQAMDLTKGDDNLFGMYMVCMTKVALTNPDKKLTNDEMYKQASTVLAKYCAEKKNKLKPSRKLKKIIKSLN